MPSGGEDVGRVVRENASGEVWQDGLAWVLGLVFVDSE